MMIPAYWRVLGLAACLVVAFVACEGDAAKERAPATPEASRPATPGSELGPGKEVTLDEARSMVPFDVILPSFIPNGASQVPTVSVLDDADGDANRIELMYWEDGSSSAFTRPVRIRITEAAGTEMAITARREVVGIRGVEVGFATGPFTKGNDAGVDAVWNYKGIGFGAEFYWLPAEGTVQGEVTEQMRADALKVIESMIQ
jgi:hypothetical protein